MSLVTFACISLPLTHPLTWQSVRMLQDKVDKLTSENNQLRVYASTTNRITSLLVYVVFTPFLLPPTPLTLFSPFSTLCFPPQSDSNKLRQRLNLPSSAASAPLKTPRGSAAQSQSSSLNIIAIMLILVALILGYLVGKWL